MKLISKEKLIKTIVYDLIDFRKIVSDLYTEEFSLIVNYRVEKVYNLNYTMDRETQLFLYDLIINYTYSELPFKDLKTMIKKELNKLIK